jgi:hypothetical protein
VFVVIESDIVQGRMYRGLQKSTFRKPDNTCIA